MDTDENMRLKIQPPIFPKRKELLFEWRRGKERNYFNVSLSSHFISARNLNMPDPHHDFVGPRTSLNEKFRTALSRTWTLVRLRLPELGLGGLSRLDSSQSVADEALGSAGKKFPN